MSFKRKMSLIMAVIFLINCLTVTIIADESDFQTGRIDDIITGQAAETDEAAHNEDSADAKDGSGEIITEEADTKNEIKDTLEVIDTNAIKGDNFENQDLIINSDSLGRINVYDITVSDSTISESIALDEQNDVSVNEIYDDVVSEGSLKVSLDDNIKDVTISSDTDFVNIT